MGKKLHKPGENPCKLFKSKNKMRCSAPFRVCIKRVVEAKQNQELWERSHTNQENPCKLLLHKRKNEIRCSAPLRICIKRVVEAKQNQELWERSHTKPCKLLLHKRKNEIRCSALLRIYLANYKLSKTSKT